VVGYGPFSLWVIHKEGLCPSSGAIIKLMMIGIMFYMYLVEFSTEKIALFFSRMFQGD
jgi:hypothetical protein